MDTLISVIVSIWRNGQYKYGYGLLDLNTGHVQVDYPEFADNAGVWHRAVCFGDRLDRCYVLRRTEDPARYEVPHIDGLLATERLIPVAA